MKKLTIIFLLLTSSLFSQRSVDTLYNFKVDAGSIVWQKVFETKENTNKLIAQLKINEFTSKLNFKESKIFGRTNKYSKSVVKFSPYYASFGFDAFLTIDIKEDKIRVTAKEVIFDGPTIAIYGVEKKQNYKLEDQAIRRNKIKNNNSTNKVLKSLDSILSSKFIFKEKITEDW